VIISLIAAMDERRGIGIEGRLPWRLSADLKKFRSLTMGHHLIAGRKTCESIGRPLPGRTMIIVTRDQQFQAAGCLVAHSVDEALAQAAARGESEVFIIGGAEIYAQTINRADRLYLTQVHATVAADVFFPEFDPGAWSEKEVWRHAADEKNQYSFTFRELERKLR
jgi:dihydrofolate reductase